MLSYYDGVKSQIMYGKHRDKSLGQKIHITQFFIDWGKNLSFFSLLLSVLILLDIYWIFSAIIATFYTWGCVAVSDYFFQVHVNLGSSLPKINVNEESEWDLPLDFLPQFIKNMVPMLDKDKIWIPKLFVGNRRKIQIPLGVLLILISTGMFIWRITL